MKKTFFQRLQRVKIKDIYHVVLFLIAIIPGIIYKHTHAPFWLICDYEKEARDNGFFFFKYMCAQQPQQRVWYAIDKKSPDYIKVKNIGQVAYYGSLKHWILYLAAQVNISSQKGGKPNAALCYALEISGLLKNRRVFLQHGITKDDLSYVHYNNAKFWLFITTTKREQDFVSGKFGYPEGAVKQLGMCRYDYLFDESKGNKILVMPTWRQWIAHKDYKSKAVENVDGFKETLYYKSWSELLGSSDVQELLNSNNMELLFYPHRNMQDYASEFLGKEKDRITIATWPQYDLHQLIRECDMLITDYSSVAMDFAYLDKPVIYYQFDYEQFRKGHLEEGYFDYKDDGFGPICGDKKQVIEALIRYIENKFKLEEKYTHRINDFFDLRDKENCKRTYEAINNML